VTYETVLRWEECGLIKLVYKDRHRQRHYSYRDLEKLIRLKSENPRIAIKQYQDHLAHMKVLRIRRKENARRQAEERNDNPLDRKDKQ